MLSAPDPTRNACDDGGLEAKEWAAKHGNICYFSASGLKMAALHILPNGPSSPQVADTRRRAAELRNGIEVREEELRLVTAQRVYKMRCECGRSWFEIELPKFVQCPACAKLGVVSQ
jgi:hypothetical protein